MVEPGINVLAHSREDDPKEPPRAPGSACLEQMEIVRLARDRACGAGAGRTVQSPEHRITRNEGV